MKEYNQGHATARGIAKDVSLREPTIYCDPPEFNGDEMLSRDEIDFFVENGYLVKRGLVKDQLAFKQAIDLMWDNVPDNILDRNEPATWTDAPHEKWTEEYVDQVGRLHNGNWKMRSRGAEGIGTQTFLVDRIANCPSILKLASHLLGSPIEPARRVRGVYAIFPKPSSANWSLGPHGDYMASHLSAMVLADEVPPHCGGFAVWPGSHSRLHPCWDMVHGSIMTEARLAPYAETRDQILRDTTPVEFAGRAGDVVFWHPRMLHSAGVNHSAEMKNPVVRVVIPCDYQRAGLSYFDDLQHGPGPMYQYWVDTRNFREDVPATLDNMWSNWNV